MNAAYVIELVAAGLGALVAVGGLVSGRGPRLYAATVLVLLTVGLAAVWFGDPQSSERGRHVVLLVAGVLAVAGGGLVTTQVFALVDKDAARTVRAGEVLRGGAWIGALERLAVFVTLIASWGPGLAIVLAVKGLGRYPELRNQDDTGAAERFIIGTFSSVLWAAGCAGLAVLTR